MFRGLSGRTPGGSPLELLTWPEFDARAVDAYVTSRAGGVSIGSYESLNLGMHVGDRESDVLENRSRLAAGLGADLADFVFCDHANRTDVAVVGAADRGRGAFSRDDAVPHADALVTATPGVVLAVMVADCAPLVIHERRAGVLACVHAGWRGSVQGVTLAAVATMRQLGADPAAMIVGVGPTIHPVDLKVGQDVAVAARVAFRGQSSQVIRADGTGRWTFDLVRANVLHLVRAGVPSEQIHVSGLSTGPNTQFFSRKAHNPCGRFAAVARLRAD